MKLSYLIQRLKNGTTLNVSYDFWDDVDFVYHINNSLQIIFAQMNSLGNRFFSNVKEELWSTDDAEKDEFTTQYDISRIWEIKADGKTILQPANVHFDLENPDWNEWGAGDFYVSGPNKIKTKEKYKKIEITYARFPKWHDFEKVKEEDVDLPDQLIWALEFYVFWRLMPVFYEQGASLANNYLSQAKEHLENYAANIWLLTAQKWFTN